MSGSTYAYPKSCVRQYQQVHVPTDATYANCRTLLTMLLLSTAVNIFFSRFLKQEFRFLFPFLADRISITQRVHCSIHVTSFMVFLSIAISSFYLQYNTPALYWNTATANAFIANILLFLVNFDFNTSVSLYLYSLKSIFFISVCFPLS